MFMNSCVEEADLGAAVVVAIAAWLWCRTHVSVGGAKAKMFVGNESKATVLKLIAAAIRIAEKFLTIIAVLCWKTLEGRLD
jgi:hypothetical protein